MIYVTVAVASCIGNIYLHYLFFKRTTIISTVLFISTIMLKE